MSLTEANLAALEAANPPVARARVEDESTVSSGVDSNGHSKGNERKVNTMEKWCVGALRALGKTEGDLVVPERSRDVPLYAIRLTPNDQLCSEVLAKLAEWFEDKVTGDAVGVATGNGKPVVPAGSQKVGKQWLRRAINARLREMKQPELPKEWGSTISGGRALAKRVSHLDLKRKAEDGSLFRSKQDLNPTPEEITAMCFTGWTGDQRVHADMLSSIEAGASVAIFLPTGSRPSEVEKMHFQTISYKTIAHNKSGIAFECLQMTAFETKVKEIHMNQFLAHSNPWRCGVGLFGLSLLVRVSTVGPPPFQLEVTPESWKLFGSNMNTLGDRLKTVFQVAGIEREAGDALKYIGRHYGTRDAQHQGVSTEGGAARRGHGDGKTSGFHYTETPLPDLLRLAGNDADTPFLPAHHSIPLRAKADEVVNLLFPDLLTAESCLQQARDLANASVNPEKIRREHHLSARDIWYKAIRFSCRTAILCLVARPRTWKKNAILEQEKTLWQRFENESKRVLCQLFGGKADAIRKMNELAIQVREAEEDEISRCKGGGNPDLSPIIDELIATRRSQEKLFSVLLDRHSPPVQEKEPPVEEETSPPACLPEPLPGLSVKHERVSQSDVRHFSSFLSMDEAVTYFTTDLMKREETHGASWRRMKKPDGREDKSRSFQWDCYRALGVFVGWQMETGKTRDQAICNLQTLFDSHGKHKPFLKELKSALKGVNAEKVLKNVR